MKDTTKFNFNKVHVPFRASKITRFLSDSLEGKCKVVLCICVSKYLLHVEETFSSLLFASQASTLKIDSRKNDVYTISSIGNTSLQTPNRLKGDRNITPSKNNLNTPSKRYINTPKSIINIKYIANQSDHNQP